LAFGRRQKIRTPTLQHLVLVLNAVGILSQLFQVHRLMCCSCLSTKWCSPQCHGIGQEVKVSQSYWL